jgi:hypothetical protein
MSSDDNAAFFERCPLCRKPMQVVRLESGVPGLPPGMRRQMIIGGQHVSLLPSTRSLSNRNNSASPRAVAVNRGSQPAFEAT